MPELPEIASRAKELNLALPGKVITAIEINQLKCLNCPPQDFTAGLVGAKIDAVTCRGKWIFTHTSQGWLLINLGMGGELRLVDRSGLPARHTFVFEFDDSTCLSISFWWFGYVHFVAEGGLSSHAMTAKLGPNVLDLDLEDFQRLITGKRIAVKSFLLDQSKVAGIGNAYIHDILFLAGIHPLRRLDSLSGTEQSALYQGIQDGLRPSLAKNGAFYEKDIYGREGGFGMNEILVGYRENQPCPRCGTPIVKIKTGGTSSFICPSHQPLEPEGFVSE